MNCIKKSAYTKQSKWNARQAQHKGNTSYRMQLSTNNIQCTASVPEVNTSIQRCKKKSQSHQCSRCLGLQKHFPGERISIFLVIITIIIIITYRTYHRSYLSSSSSSSSSSPIIIITNILIFDLPHNSMWFKPK